MDEQSTIDYSIDKLPAIFATHARIANNIQQEQMKNFVENCPGQPIPDHMKDPFNIALALSIMAQAIKDLQAKP